MASAVKDVFKNLPAAPDLRGLVKVLDFKPFYPGPYSLVYRGELRRDNGTKPVAVKVLNAVPGTTLTTMLRKLDRERRTWGALSHPNILPLYGFVDDDEFFKPFGALISPWREHGDAAKFLERYGHSMTFENRISLWKGVVRGVDYLHSYKPLLIHGDLKPRNILIDDLGRAQICDFGLVRVFLDEGSSGTTTTSVHTGTERYLARELIACGDEARPTPESDVYAVGCIGLEFVFLRMPYVSRKNNYRGLIFSDIKEGKPPAYRPPDLHPTLQPIWTYLEECWDLNPMNRPRATSLSWQLERWSSNSLPPRQLSRASFTEECTHTVGSTNMRAGDTAMSVERASSVSLFSTDWPPFIEEQDEDEVLLMPRVIAHCEALHSVSPSHELRHAPTLGLNTHSNRPNNWSRYVPMPPSCSGQHMGVVTHENDGPLESSSLHTPDSHRIYGYDALNASNLSTLGSLTAHDLRAMGFGQPRALRPIRSPEPAMEPLDRAAAEEVELQYLKRTMWVTLDQWDARNHRHMQRRYVDQSASTHASISGQKRRQSRSRSSDQSSFWSHNVTIGRVERQDLQVNSGEDRRIPSNRDDYSRPSSHAEYYRRDKQHASGGQNVLRETIFYESKTVFSPINHTHTIPSKVARPRYGANRSPDDFPAEFDTTLRRPRRFLRSRSRKKTHSEWGGFGETDVSRMPQSTATEDVDPEGEDDGATDDVSCSKVGTLGMTLTGFLQRPSNKRVMSS